MEAELGLLFFALIAGVHLCNGKHLKVEMDVRRCSNTLVKLMSYTDVTLTVPRYLRARESRDVGFVEEGETCRASFRTDDDFGICVNVLALNFPDCGPEVEFQTTAFEVDKRYTCNHHERKEWCTKEHTLTVALHPTLKRNSLVPLLFQFAIKNVSKELIPTEVYMDSYVQCGEVYLLEPGTSMTVHSRRDPVVNRLPQVCEIVVLSLSTEDYEEVCVSSTSFYIHSCGTSLNVTGVSELFYEGPFRVLDCTSPILVEEFCSQGRTLSLRLHRWNNSYPSSKFSLTIASKRHPRWEDEYALRWEERALAAIKGLTIAVATIDTTVALAAVVLTLLIKHPRGVWKGWAQSIQKERQAAAFVASESYPEVLMPAAESGCAAKV